MSYNFISSILKKNNNNNKLTYLTHTKNTTEFSDKNLLMTAKLRLNLLLWLAKWNNNN